MGADFEPSVLLGSCEKCQREDGSLATDHYLSICHQLINISSALGLQAALAASREAVKCLEIRRVVGTGCYYTNIRLLLQYEAQNELGEAKARVRDGAKKKVRSGTVALTTLHRTMGFVIALLTELDETLTKKEKLNRQRRLQIYKDHLAQHQSAMTRTAVNLALTRLSGKKQMLQRLSVDHQHLQQLLRALKPVFVNVAQAFTDAFHASDLNDLPTVPFVEGYGEDAGRGAKGLFLSEQ